MPERTHGSPYDRGGADYYYHRPRLPHYGGVGGSSGPRVELDPTTPDHADLIAEYHAGYDEAVKQGDQKEWE